MVKIRKPKKENQEILPLDNQEVVNETLSKSEEFINKNKNYLILFFGIITISIAAFSIFSYLKSNQNENAQNEMFQAVYYFEKDSLVQALNGDGNNYGFLEIIDEYSLSEAANLSRFYAGASYLKLGNYQNAINYLDQFSSSDLLVQARAYSLIGDAYVELEDYENAIYYFEKACETYVRAASTGFELEILSNEIAEKTAKQMENYKPSNVADLYFKSLMKILDNENSDYKN